VREWLETGDGFHEQLTGFDALLKPSLLATDGHGFTQIKQEIME